MTLSSRFVGRSAESLCILQSGMGQTTQSVSASPTPARLASTPCPGFWVLYRSIPCTSARTQRQRVVTGRQWISAFGSLEVEILNQEGKERPCLYNHSKVEHWRLNEPNTKSTFYTWFTEVIAHIYPVFGQRLLTLPLTSKNRMLQFVQEI